MNKNGKRVRNVNFSRKETTRLIQVYKKIIENKKSDAVTWQDKAKAWKAIETEYNSTKPGVYRNARHLKLKYEALKRDARKKVRASNVDHRNTDDNVNGMSRLTPVEQKVQNMILMTGEDCDSINDSDPLGTPREQNPTDNLSDEKLEIDMLNKRIIEELEEKILRKQMMKDELHYKNELYKLEIEQKLLTIEMLKTDLQNKKKLY